MPATAPAALLIIQQRPFQYARIYKLQTPKLTAIKHVYIQLSASLLNAVSRHPHHLPPSPLPHYHLIHPHHPPLPASPLPSPPHTSIPSPTSPLFARQHSLHSMNSPMRQTSEYCELTNYCRNTRDSDVASETCSALRYFTTRHNHQVTPT